MSAHRCCNAATSATGRKTLAAHTDGRIQPPKFIRRCFGIAEWIVPGALLALLPKCPICLVAYVVLATGVGLPLSIATYLRITLVALSLASLFYLSARSIYRVRYLKAGR